MFSTMILFSVPLAAAQAHNNIVQPCPSQLETQSRSPNIPWLSAPKKFYFGFFLSTGLVSRVRGADLDVHLKCSDAELCVVPPAAAPAPAPDDYENLVASVVVWKEDKERERISSG